MSKLHQKFMQKSSHYKKWHEYEYHEHHHWLVAVCAALIAVSAIAGAWQISIDEQNRLFLGLLPVKAATTVIKIDPSKHYQKILGFGGNIDLRAGRWAMSENYKNMLSDFQPSYVRYAINVFAGWEKDNDNSDPETINWSYFDNHLQSITDGSDLKNEINGLKYLASQGINIIYAIQNVPCWVDTSGSVCRAETQSGQSINQRIDKSMYSELAESITSYFLYLKNQGVNIKFFSINEPQDGINIKWDTPDELGSFYEILGQMFADNNLSTKLMVPDSGQLNQTYSDFFGWADGLMENNNLKPFIGALSYHGYDVGLHFRDRNSYNEYKDELIRAKSYADKYGLPLIVGEYAIFSSESGTYRIHSERADYAFDFLALSQDLYNLGGSYLLLPWSLTGWSPMVCCDSDQQGSPWEKFPIYHYFNLLHKFVIAGSILVETTNTNSPDFNLYSSAFLDSQNNLTVVLAARTEGTVNLEIAGFGSKTLKRYETVGNSYAQKSEVSTANNLVSITVPANGLTILFSGSSNLPVPSSEEEMACADSLDNDSDGKIDYPADPGCTSTVDDNETDPSPPVCNDNGICDSGEDTQHCPDDCPAPAPPADGRLTADFNCDNYVNIYDFGNLMSCWGSAYDPNHPYNCAGGALSALCGSPDLTGDGQVDVNDLGVLLSGWQAESDNIEQLN